MNKYLLSFDLDSSIPGYEQEYSKVESAVQNLGRYCKPLNNVFIIASNHTHLEIRKTILECSQSVEAILVVQLEGTYASYNYKEKNDELSQVMSN